MTDTVLWDQYCTATHAAAHPAPHDVSGLIEFRYSVDHLRLEYAELVRVLWHAEAAEWDRAPVLRAHLPRLRQLRDEAAALVAEAEAA